MKGVARFVNAAFAEEENRLAFAFLLLAIVTTETRLREPEPIERHLVVGVENRDQVRIVIMDGLDPAGFGFVLLFRKPPVARRIRDRLRELLLGLVEQSELYARKIAARRERKNMEERPGRIAFPDGAEIGQLDKRLRAHAFSRAANRIDRFRGEKNRPGALRSKNFIPVQRQRFVAVGSTTR